MKLGKTTEKWTQKTAKLRASRCTLCKKSQIVSLGDQQEKSNVFRVFRGITNREIQQEKVVDSLIYREG